ncbi:MAG: hypothetical protein KAS73_01365 [Candidatus Sabulitectum sp.]|nr:hypothetical protein [Candidatus Sabulitectum sp.]
MIRENELLTLLLAAGLWFFLLFGRKRITQLPKFKILGVAFAVTTAAWVFSVLEGFFLMDFFHFLEHFCYAASSMIFAMWCWRIFSYRNGNIH